MVDSGGYRTQPTPEPSWSLPPGENTEATASAVQLELQASGGKAYLCAHGSAFARRWRESAFVPIVTPSLVQLRAELLRQAKVSA